jgi:hypothetical protein
MVTVLRISGLLCKSVRELRRVDGGGVLPSLSFTFALLSVVWLLPFPFHLCLPGQPLPNLRVESLDREQHPQ